jgi:hypothetical protein
VNCWMDARTAYLGRNGRITRHSYKAGRRAER